jgi:hypothetical protein
MSYPVAHWHDSPGDDVMVLSAPISDILGCFYKPKSLCPRVVIVLSLCKRRRATWGLGANGRNAI